MNTKIAQQLALGLSVARVELGVLRRKQVIAQEQVELLPAAIEAAEAEIAEYEALLGGDADRLLTEIAASGSYTYSVNSSTLD